MPHEKNSNPVVVHRGDPDKSDVNSVAGPGIGEDLVQLNELLIAGRLGEFAEFLGVMSKRVSMSIVAERFGLARESLYKALRANAQLRLDTALKVLSAHGLKLAIVPKE